MLVPIAKTVFLAILPIIELRGSLPVALLVYHLPVWIAYTASVIGSFLAAIPIVYLLIPVSNFFADHFKVFKKFFDWLFGYAKKKHSKKFEAIEDMAVFVVAALPIPLAGVWSAALLAVVFGVKPKKSLPLIFAGTVVAGIIVLVITKGVTFFV